MAFLSRTQVSTESLKNAAPIIKEVYFKKSFLSEPDIFFTPIFFDIACGIHSTTRYHIKLVSVEKDKFTCEIKTWLRTRIWGLTFKWLAVLTNNLLSTEEKID